MTGDQGLCTSYQLEICVCFGWRGNTLCCCGSYQSRKHLAVGKQDGKDDGGADDPDLHMSLFLLEYLRSGRILDRTSFIFFII